MERVIITGANRGLGLELTRQYLARGDRVFGACRNPDSAAELQALAGQYPDRLTPLRLEVTDVDQITQAAAIVREAVDGLDVLFNNAGINPPGETQQFGRITPHTMLHTFHVNSVGPLLIVQALADLLKAGTKPRVINITSGLGSIAQRGGGGSHAYHASKAALNMITRGLAINLRPSGVIAIVIDPGWVKTDMGGPGAHLEPAESIRRMMKIADNLTLSDTGKFLRHDGAEVPW